MTFKGTDHYRKKAQCFTRAVSYLDEDGVYHYRGLYYSRDVSELCDRVDQLQEVVEAAREIHFSSVNPRANLDMWPRLGEALRALEAEEEA